MMERHHKMEHIQRDHFMLPKLAWKSDELRMEQSVFEIKVRVLLCEGWVCTAMYVCALCLRVRLRLVLLHASPRYACLYSNMHQPHNTYTAHTTHSATRCSAPPRSFLKRLRWRWSMRRTLLFTTVSWEASMARRWGRE
jgi:adenylate kinase family enzyme